MDYSQFRFNLLLRIAAISFSAFLLADFINDGLFQLSTLLITALIVFQIISLLKFLQLNKEFVQVSASETIDEHQEINGDLPLKDDQELLKRYQVLQQKIADVRNEKDAQSQYLKTIVQHLGIGLMTFDRSGDIQIINTTAKKLLKVKHLKNISGLSRFSEPLVKSFQTLKTGGQDLVKIQHEGYTYQLSIYAIELTLKGEPFKLITLQNIQSELEEKEMEAWQNLIRVLTHEIMNSVTPISSLAATVDGDLKNNIEENLDRYEIEKEDLADIHRAIQTIQRRSEGLIRFVSDFRNLTRIPTPRLKEVRVQEIFQRVLTLLKHDLDQNNINVGTSIRPSDLTIKVDPELIEQVMINIVKNAIQALEERLEKHIQLSANSDNKDNVTIRIKDNGAGIDEEALGKIFIPFFTTKKNGSGIGLSLSKQIMRQHKGAIKVVSNLDQGTEFSLRFEGQELEKVPVL
ncbi:MAG: histidine kinase [Cyclobacteriaceae bacterium]|nr:MAG: histidine kinase [Cyclobacteriaceae bacterium]